MCIYPVSTNKQMLASLQPHGLKKLTARSLAVAVFLQRLLPQSFHTSLRRYVQSLHLSSRAYGVLLLTQNSNAYFVSHPFTVYLCTTLQFSKMVCASLWPRSFKICLLFHDLATSHQCLCLSTTLQCQTSQCVSPCHFISKAIFFCLRPNYI